MSKVEIKKSESLQKVYLVSTKKSVINVNLAMGGCEERSGGSV